MNNYSSTVQPKFLSNPCNKLYGVVLTLGFRITGLVAPVSREPESESKVQSASQFFAKHLQWTPTWVREALNPARGEVISLNNINKIDFTKNSNIQFFVKVQEIIETHRDKIPMEDFSELLKNKKFLEVLGGSLQFYVETKCHETMDRSFRKSFSSKPFITYTRKEAPLRDFSRLYCTLEQAKIIDSCLNNTTISVLRTLPEEEVNVFLDDLIMKFSLNGDSMRVRQTKILKYTIQGDLSAKEIAELAGSACSRHIARDRQAICDYIEKNHNISLEGLITGWFKNRK